jgi:hypothetical protein
MKPNDTPRTLTVSDISSERSFSRRSLLRMIGIGAGLGAASVLLPATPGEAQGGVSVGAGDITGAPSPSATKKPAFRAQAPPKNAATTTRSGRITGVAQDPADPAAAQTGKRSPASGPRRMRIQ